MGTSTRLRAMVLLGVLLGSASLAAAQAPEYSRDGEQAIIKALEDGKWKPAIDQFTDAVRKKDARSWCTNSFFLGWVLRRSGRPREAIAVFDDLFNNAETLNCATHGLLPAWHYIRGIAYDDNGQLKEAAASLAQAAYLAPTVIPADFWPRWSLRLVQPTKENCYDWLSQVQMKLESYQEAAASYRKLIELNPKKGEWYSRLARAYTFLKQYDDGLAAAKKGVDIEPDAYAYAILGDLQTARTRYDEAIEAYRTAAEKNPKWPEVYVEWGKACLGNDDFDGAIAAVTKAAELAPDNPTPPYQIGVICSRAGRFDQAIAAYGKAIALASYVGIRATVRIEQDYPVLQRDVPGNSGLEDGPAKLAGLRAGDIVTKIDGRSTKGWDVNKVSESLRGGENTQVVLTVQRPEQSKPIVAAVTRQMIVRPLASAFFGERSLCARETGDRAGAVRDAEQAYSLNPLGTAARQALAAVNLDRARYDEARRLLAPLKDNPLARLLEATAFARQGDARQAVEVFTSIPEEDLLANRAVRQNAKKALLQILQGYVQERVDHAQALQSAGHFLEAVAEYAEAIKVADEATSGRIRQRVASLVKSNAYLGELHEAARPHALRGDVLIKEGAFVEALAEYRAAVKLAPFNAQLHFNTALIQEQLKSYRAAIASMNAYLQLNPEAPNVRAAKDAIYKWEFALERARKK